MKSEYLILLALVVIPPLILSRDRRLGLYRHPGALFKSMAVVCGVFWTWDVIATGRGHWWFNPRYVLGVSFLGIPLEEWLFFVVISFVSIFTWESTKYFLGRRK